MRLDIDLLRSFATVAETGVLGRAADRLGRTQAAISMQMKRLEEGLDRPLLKRTGRGVTLTLEGERLLVHARNILRFHDDAAAELTGAELRGSVRFGCPDDYAAVLLSPLLRSFARRYPQVLIEVTCAPTPRLREKLKLQLLDIALVSLPDSVPSRDVLRREPLVWVGRKKIDVRALDPLPVALSDRDTLDFQAATQGLSEMGKDYRIAYSSGSMGGLLAVVRSGLAITVLTKTAVPRDLMILRPGEGLPKLPNVLIGVETDQRISNNLTSALEQHLRSMLPGL
jgi:DNA-binding transcriptional LysR family regulator